MIIVMNLHSKRFTQSNGLINPESGLSVDPEMGVQILFSHLTCATKFSTTSTNLIDSDL